MRLAILFISLLSVSYNFSQTDLYVSSNAANYIYVDGTIFDDTPSGPMTPSTNVPIFVTNNIQLAGPNSFIYLRNEAQLFQSDTSTGNSGSGSLSVYQEGNVGAYEYNYWCSPIGDRTIVSTVSNLFGVSLLNDVVSVTFSTPATVSHHANYNGTSSPLDIEERWIYTYTTPSNLYSDWIPNFSTTTINPGEGFTMKGVTGTSANNPGSAQRYDFRGKPNTGTFAMNVAAPLGPLPEDALQTLVGNPYPSAMDARLYLHDGDNAAAIDGSLYYWEQKALNTHLIRQYEGGYGTYTINAPPDAVIESYTPAVFLSYDGYGTSTGPTGDSGTKTARRYIPIGQGFMVQGRVLSSGTVRAKNSMRVFYKESSGSSEFFRASSDNSYLEQSTGEVSYNALGLAIVPNDVKRFRVNVEFNNLYKRQLLQNFASYATEGFDYGLEGKVFENLDSDAFWVLDEERYVIQAFSFDENLKIPLNVIVTEAQPIGFSIFDIQNFDNSQPIYIHDKQENIYVDLRTQNYEINLPQGNYNDRFEITFTQETLSTPVVTQADFKILQNNPQAQLTILNPNGLKIKNVQLVDTSGKQIFNVPILSVETEYHFATKTLSDGIYVATITLDDTKAISKKVIVKN